MGAINAYIMSKFPPGQEEKAIEALQEFWLNIKDENVYKSWTFGFVEGIFFKPGLYDSTPMKSTLQKLISQYPNLYHRKLAIPLSDINSGDIHTFDENVKLENLPTYLLAAISKPGFFPPIAHKESLYVDASVVASLDITGAIEKCREIVEHDEDIVLDIIMVQKIKDLSTDCSNYIGIQMLMRYVFFDDLM